MADNNLPRQVVPAHNHSLGSLPSITTALATKVTNGGAGAAGRIAFWTNATTISGDAGLTWTDTAGLIVKTDAGSSNVATFTSLDAYAFSIITVQASTGQDAGIKFVSPTRQSAYIGLHGSGASRHVGIDPTDAANPGLPVFAIAAFVDGTVQIGGSYTAGAGGAQLLIKGDSTTVPPLVVKPYINGGTTANVVEFYNRDDDLSVYLDQYDWLHVGSGYLSLGDAGLNRWLTSTPIRSGRHFLHFSHYENANNYPKFTVESTDDYSGITYIGGGTMQGATNEALGDTWICAGRSSGNAAPANLGFATTTAGVSGYDEQTLTERMRLWADGGLQIGGTFVASMGAGTLAVKGATTNDMTAYVENVNATYSGDLFTIHHEGSSAAFNFLVIDRADDADAYFVVAGTGTTAIGSSRTNLAPSGLDILAYGLGTNALAGQGLYVECSTSVAGQTGRVFGIFARASKTNTGASGDVFSIAAEAEGAYNAQAGTLTVGYTVWEVYGYREVGGMLIDNVQSDSTDGTSITYGLRINAVDNFNGQPTYAIYVDSVPSYFGGEIRGVQTGASSPMYSFEADKNTGMFSPSADKLGFATAGLERMRIWADGGVQIGGTYTASPGASHLAIYSAEASGSISSVTNTSASFSGQMLYLYKDGASSGTFWPIWYSNSYDASQGFLLYDTGYIFSTYHQTNNTVNEGALFASSVDGTGSVDFAGVRINAQMYGAGQTGELAGLSVTTTKGNSSTGVAYAGHFTALVQDNAQTGVTGVFATASVTTGNATAQGLVVADLTVHNGTAYGLRIEAISNTLTGTGKKWGIFVDADPVWAGGLFYDNYTTTAVSATISASKTRFTGNTAGQTLTLPTALRFGANCYIRNAASVNVSVAAGSGTTIEGLATFTLAPGESILVYLLGTDWTVF